MATHNAREVMNMPAGQQLIQSFHDQFFKYFYGNFIHFSKNKKTFCKKTKFFGKLYSFKESHLLQNNFRKVEASR